MTRIRTTVLAASARPIDAGPIDARPIDARPIDAGGAMLESARWSSSALAERVAQLAADSRSWIERVRFRAGERWYERIERSDAHEVWAISWLPGQGTGFHDHGGSAGAFAVAFGTLEEHQPGLAPHRIDPGQVRAFGSHDVHDVRNASSAPAVSIHAYSPPLSVMHRYELAEDGLQARGTVFEEDEARERDEEDEEDEERRAATAGRSSAPRPRLRPRSIDDVLSAARTRVQRLSPEQAHAAASAGALLVDIRPTRQRAQEGEIPGAIVIERNVLEWRLDPASDARLPVASGYDRSIVIVCSAGYASSLAAVSLQELGLFRATDLIGGFQAWRAAGLPVTRAFVDADSDTAA